MTNYHPTFRSPIIVQEPAGERQNLRSPHGPSKIHAPLMGNPKSKIQNPKLHDLTGVPVILIQSEANDVLPQYFATIPAKPGELVDVGQGLLARLTLGQFYLFGKHPTAALPSAAQLDDSFRQAQCFAHATDYTHGKAVLRLVGAASQELLSKICGLDFHHTVFPNMHAAQTSAAKIKTLIARYDEAGTLAYYLHVERPLGQYFWEVVWDAGQEFGVSVES